MCEYCLKTRRSAMRYMVITCTALYIISKLSFKIELEHLTIDFSK